ncbi:carboxypeptidase B-like [Drosophila rhopaloa]|uniref:Carboxypeptidase B-like n=1 Tax=Drosophila rhopaloa TaxID=1041015 RepID=A0A6P4EVK5_DRORH|nr:carboxypeptidase B-like [Drosophila rhopaloa]
MWRPLSAIVFLMAICLLTAYDDYSYVGLMQSLDELAQHHRDRITLREVGITYQDRSLILAMITNGDGRLGKRVIFVVAALHGDWMSVRAAFKTIKDLVLDFQDNADLLADFDWHIMPLANPDGYEYSRKLTSNFRWSKTRTRNNVDCIGTNLNRNFDVGWGVGFPELHDPCDQNYAGSAPFSEVEARTVRDIMQNLIKSERGVMYLSLHTFLRSVIYPWVYNSTWVPNQGENIEIAKFVTDQIFIRTGKVKAVGVQYGRKSGDTSIDYAFKMGFPLSFACEMSGLDRVNNLVICIRAFGKKAIEKYPPSRPIHQSEEHRPTKNSASRNWDLAPVL